MNPGRLLPSEEASFRNIARNPGLTYEPRGTSAAADPEIGEWYRCRDRNECFHVTAFDESSAEVHVESRDGTLDEWPLSHGYELGPETAAPPQDWRGPLDCAPPGAEDEEPLEVDVAVALEPIGAAGDVADRQLLDRLAQDIAILRRRHRVASPPRDR